MSFSWDDREVVGSRFLMDFINWNDLEMGKDAQSVMMSFQKEIFHKYRTKFFHKKNIKYLLMLKRSFKFNQHAKVFN